MPLSTPHRPRCLCLPRGGSSEGPGLSLCPGWAGKGRPDPGTPPTSPWNLRASVHLCTSVGEMLLKFHVFLVFVRSPKVICRRIWCLDTEGDHAGGDCRMCPRPSPSLPARPQGQRSDPESGPPGRLHACGSPGVLQPPSPGPQAWPGREACDIPATTSLLRAPSRPPPDSGPDGAEPRRLGSRAVCARATRLLAQDTRASPSPGHH